MNLAFSTLVQAVFLLFFLGGLLHAQFSPGELTSSHADLEGLDKCTLCHELGKKIDGNRCLDCHTLIRDRLSAKKGYHGSSAVRSKECVACHIDHKGRGFDLIKWEGGRTSFSHDVTGFRLEGRHKTDRCESCHKPSFVKDKAVISRSSEGLSLSKTYLGLSQNCQSCHFDEHRNQFDKNCTTCHDFEDWKKSAGVLFDHDKARFRLTGKHAEAACIQCHKPVADARKKPNGESDPDYLKFKELTFDRCTACHKDPHSGKFGQNCEKCHVPGGWQNVTISGFDHTKTGYPLTGRHLMVDCEKCHKPDKKKKSVYKGLPHDQCAQCHRDAHAGQFTNRSDRGRCEACHATTGFVPSFFSVTVHNEQAKFKLIGAHVAVACNLCHIRASGQAFAARTGLTTLVDSATTLFHFSSTRCADCHEDVHRGQFAERVQTGGCESCHTSTEDWRKLNFDHNKDSRFPLKGKHANVACEKCHPSMRAAPVDRVISFKPLDTQCQSCHFDIHYGQFLSNETKLTSCDACHTEEGFKMTIFDHNKQARFKLTGAHENVKCDQCHHSVPLANGAVVTVFKPVDARCASCHAAMK